MNPGDKVVCVDDNWAKSPRDPKPHCRTLPVAGRVYVIRRWVTCRNGEPALQLIGCDPTSGPFVGFYPWRFRLLSETKNQTTRREAIAA
jgi:hypothetical protein